jgi:electron transfer flavoprotein beta subunit
MKIVVAYKWARNPQDASVGPDGAVDWSRAKAAVSEYDAVAIEVGRRVATATAAELVGMTVGTMDANSPMARKAALSRGLDRLVVVADDDLATGNATATARLLAAAVRREGDVALVLAGDASIDVGAGLVPALLAGELGWPALVQAGSVTIDGDCAVVEREIDGSVQTLSVALPAVLAVASGAVQPQLPGMKDILAAGKKPTDTLGPEALETAPVTPVAVAGTARPEPTHRRGDVVDGLDPDSAAEALVGKLRAAGVL